MNRTETLTESAAFLELRLLQSVSLIFLLFAFHTLKLLLAKSFSSMDLAGIEFLPTILTITNIAKVTGDVIRGEAICSTLLAH